MTTGRFDAAFRIGNRASAWRRVVRSQFLLVTTLAGAPVASAQVAAPGPFSVRIDAGIALPYVWRGISNRRAEATFGTVFSLDDKLGHTAWGAWTLAFPIGVNDSRGLRHDVTLDNELDVWFERAFVFPRLLFLRDVGLVAGAAHYRYNYLSGKGLDTSELYGRFEITNIQVAHLPVQHTIRVGGWQGVGAVEGRYYEVGITNRISFFSYKSLFFGFVAGFSDGQERDDGDPTAAHYFAQSGLTHYDVSATVPFRLGGIGLASRDSATMATVSVHYQVGRDARTRTGGFITLGLSTGL